MSYQKVNTRQLGRTIICLILLVIAFSMIDTYISLPSFLPNGVLEIVAAITAGIVTSSVSCI